MCVYIVAAVVRVKQRGHTPTQEHARTSRVRIKTNMHLLVHTPQDPGVLQRRDSRIFSNKISSFLEWIYLRSRAMTILATINYSVLRCFVVLPGVPEWVKPSLQRPKNSNTPTNSMRTLAEAMVCLLARRRCPRQHKHADQNRL